MDKIQTVYSSYYTHYMIHVHSQDMIVEVHYVVISNSLTHRGIFSTIEEILYNCMKKE